MLNSVLTTAAVALLCTLNSVQGAPSDPLLCKRATTLSDGSSMQYGAVDSMVKWQSSGTLKTGCSSAAAIGTCYTAALTAGGELDPQSDGRAPRQRIEMLAAQYGNAGESWSYQWKYFITADSVTSDSTTFFHTTQLFSRTLGAYIISAGPLQGRWQVADNVRQNCGGTCPSIALSKFVGRTTSHKMAVTYGKSGSIKYTVTDTKTKEVLLTYSVKNGNVPDGGYAKTGLYRAAISSNRPAKAYLGDFNFRQV